MRVYQNHAGRDKEVKSSWWQVVEIIKVIAFKYLHNCFYSLRECLSENENLRLSNQRLQNELTKLQCDRATAASANLHTRNFNNNFNITLNSLNSNNSNGSGGGGSASSSPGGIGNSIFAALNIPPHSSNTNTFTKRELIIRDYVD